MFSVGVHARIQDHRVENGYADVEDPVLGRFCCASSNGLRKPEPRRSGVAFGVSSASDVTRGDPSAVRSGCGGRGERAVR